MSELGQYLKQKRVEQGISIEKLQEETKIRKRYIEAIEQGDYKILPGHFYARAFIKSYVEAVGLNYEQIMKEYAKELPEIPTGPIETTPPRRTKNIKPRSPKVGKWISRLVFYSFLVLVMIIVYLAAVQFWGDQPDQAIDPNSSQGPGLDSTIVDDEGQPAGDQQEPDPSEQEPEPIEEPAAEPAWTYVDTVGTTSTYRFENADRMDVTIRATNGNVWLNITNEEDGRNISPGGGETVAHNQEKTWDLAEYSQVNFRIGNTRSVEMQINGEIVDLSTIPNRNAAINLIIRYEPTIQQ